MSNQQQKCESKLIGNYIEVCYKEVDIEANSSLCGFNTDTVY